MEIKEEQLNENNQRLFRTCYSKGSATITCVLAESQRQGKECDSYIVERRENFMCALIGGRWLGETAGSLTRTAGHPI